MINVDWSKCINRPVGGGEGGGGLPNPFLKIGKNSSNLEKECPDCGHLWLKFLIWNRALLKSKDFRWVH